jgi:RNA polymerase sigma-70 factor (ECF subfamily)
MTPSTAVSETRSTELADGAVVRAVLAGDVERYEVLVARYQERLYRYALAMVLDRDTAAELAQDTLVASYQKLRGCRDPDRFAAWVFRTLRNRCLDHLKDPRRRHVPIQTQANHLVADDGDGAEAALRAIALYRPLHSALEALSPLLREPFLLRHLDGMSYEDMSEVLGASVSALKMRVMRARELLRAELLEVADG